MAYTAFVTGASGFIGSALCLKLRRQGITVRALCRSVGKARHLADAGVQIVSGDLQDVGRFRQHLAGSDVVYHVGAATSGPAIVQYNVNVTATLELAQAAKEAGVGRFVHVSSVAVYGYLVNEAIDEDYPMRPSRDDYYQQSKAIGEHLLWDYAKVSGLPVVSIRPAFVYGPGSMLWSRTLYEIARRYPVPLLNHGSGHAHPIFVDDVVDLLTVCAEHPDAPGHAFHASADPAPTWREFSGYYAAMADNSRRIELPAAPLKALGTAVTRFTRLRGEPLNVPESILAMCNSQTTFRMRRAADILDWHPQISLEEGMKRTEPWLKRVVSSR